MSYDRLLIWQYQAKPKARATAQLIDQTFADTWKGLASLPLALSIDDATGVSLDLVGKHAGQSRELPGFGRLEDPDYRFLIRCRVAKNYMTGTAANMTDMMEFIFGPASAAYDQFDMTVTVLIQSDVITPFKLYAIHELDILPRPAGVGFKLFAAVAPVAFGFYGALNSGAFNEGVFARIL